MDMLKNRSKKDRRQFSYTTYSPERRSGQDRRELSTNNFNQKGALKA